MPDRRERRSVNVGVARQRAESAPRWFHVIATTYGAWLPGDPRGFRTRHHRDHVDGDYKSPPPAGIYEGLHRNSAKLLKHDPAVLSVAQRATVGIALRTRLDELGASLIAISVSGQHVHMLLKVSPKNRPKAGWHREDARVVRTAKDRLEEEAWGKRGKYLTIRDRKS